MNGVHSLSVPAQSRGVLGHNGQRAPLFVVTLADVYVTEIAEFLI